MESQQKTLNVIVGLGKTGISCAHFLAKQGVPFAVTDSRKEPPEALKLKSDYPNIECSFGAFDEELIARATQIILSPGVPLTEKALQVAREKKIPIIGDIELFAQNVHAPVVAITGTNAKSTVTTLVGEMAKAAGKNVKVGGNLGTPALDLLGDDATEIYVLELSSFQLETTESLLPRVATILNITPDHLDRYDSFESYAEAKHRIYKNCAVSVWNRDDELTKPKQVTEAVTFGLEEPGMGMFGLRRQQDEIYLAFGEEYLLPVSQMKLQGQHNWANALAALAIGHALEFSMQSMLTVLKNFSGLLHRCQLVRELKGVRWYNDSKATNIGAAIAAIRGISKQTKGNIILILGGLGKGADFNELKNALPNQVSHVIVMGEMSQEIKTLISPLKPVKEVFSMEEAVNSAQSIAKKDDVVLLAPAGASYDMFKDFNHRGEVFIQAVEHLS